MQEDEDEGELSVILTVLSKTLVPQGYKTNLKS